MFPTMLCASRIGSGTLILADVSPASDFTLSEAFDLHLSGWNLARRGVSPFARQKIPTLMHVLFRLISFGGIAQKQNIREYADVYLTPPAGEFTFRDFHCSEEMANSAHPYARKILEDWIAENGRPWSNPAQ